MNSMTSRGTGSYDTPPTTNEATAANEAGSEAAPAGGESSVESPCQETGSDRALPWQVLTLSPQHRANVVTMRTVVALVFVLCLALDFEGVAQQRPTASLLDRAGELGSPAFLGQVALGALFVLSGILVSHGCVQPPASKARPPVTTEAFATVAATSVPAVLLAVVLSDHAAPGFVLKIVVIVVPAGVLAALTVAGVFHSVWAKRNITKIAPVLLGASMVASSVMGSVVSRHGPTLDTALWAGREFSWAQATICAVHLMTYFFAGTLVVAIGDSFLRGRHANRVMLPVMGIVGFLLCLPFAMGGMDVGQPLLALALAPLVLVPVPSLLTGHDLSAWMVVYGWPVHLILLATGASAWSPWVTAVVVCAVSVVMSGLSWRWLQRPVTQWLTRVGDVFSGLRTAWSREEYPEPRSARMRLLQMAETGDDGRTQARA